MNSKHGFAGVTVSIAGFFSLRPASRRCRPGPQMVRRRHRHRGTKRAEKALVASEQLARGQVNALKSALDALAMKPNPGQLVAHIAHVDQQFEAHSASVWRRGEVDGMVGLAFAFEDGVIVPKTDPRFAGLDLLLPMEDIWPWPEVFRSGKPSVIEDIQPVPPLALRDRLCPRHHRRSSGSDDIADGWRGPLGFASSSSAHFEQQIELAQALANQAMLMIRLAELSAQSRETAIVGERNRIAAIFTIHWPRALPELSSSWRRLKMPAGGG